MNAFNSKYGKGTLAHPGMIDQYEGKNVVKLENLDEYLGLDSSSKNQYAGHDQHEKEHYLKDEPKYWEYKNV